MKNQIERLAREAIAEKVFPGCAVGVVRKGGERLVVPVGRFTYEPASRPVTEDSIFDVASITKSIPTSSLALKLIGEGKLSPEDRLIKYVPEFHNSDRGKVLIKHLLTQTLDYSFQMSAQKDKTPDEILDVIFTSEFKSLPGSKFFYVNGNSILLGLVVERILGEPLDKLGEKYFFGPLGMKGTGFYPLKKFTREEIVPTEIQDWRGGLVQGEVHDESTFALNKELVVGSAGLFSTAPDLLTFMETILNNGSLNGRKYLSPSVIEQIYTNQIADIGESAGLGWELNQPRYMGKLSSPKTFGKTSFTGCVVIGDLEREVAIVILSNYTYPRRKANKDPINKFRQNIADTVFESIPKAP